MDWIAKLDADEAATIAAGMRVVALADGHVHPRELALIEGFASGIPADASDEVVLATSELQEVYLRSLIFVALADGKVSEPEERTIAELMAPYGYGMERVMERVLDVKREFLAAFSGVRVFRDAVVEIAAELGLSEADVERMHREG